MGNCCSRGESDGERQRLLGQSRRQQRGRPARPGSARPAPTRGAGHRAIAAAVAEAIADLPRPPYQLATAYVLNPPDADFRDLVEQALRMPVCPLSAPARLARLAAWIKNAPPPEPFKGANPHIYLAKNVFGQNPMALAMTLMTRKKRNAFRSPDAVQENRWLTRHRIVTSLRPVWVDGNGELYEPGMYVLMITLCGVNLMGTGDDSTTKKFLDETTAQTHKNQHSRDVTTYLLNSRDAFYREYYRLFRRMLWVAEKQKQDILILSGVGGGVYLNQVRSDPASDCGKEAAQRLILEALFAAICEAGNQHCRKIVLSFPDARADRRSRLFTQILSDIHPRYFDSLDGSGMTVTLVNAEMLQAAVAFKAAATAADKKLCIAVVNAGSDSTIGGGFQRCDPKTLLPVEELLALTTGFPFDQCFDDDVAGLDADNAKDRLGSRYTLKYFPGDLGNESNEASLSATPAFVPPPAGGEGSSGNGPASGASSSAAGPRISQPLSAPVPEPAAGDDRNECSVCLSGEKTHICYPCGHQCLCADCSLQLGPGVAIHTNRKCPICKTLLTGPPIKVFVA